ncbi:hypothetical protein EDC01DRAFT_732954 [Geopyxis carbonaria]|nr:hypothetical protein EDC01DRAFT_732954 [Geopyxis carbonaria]
MNILNALLSLFLLHLPSVLSAPLDTPLDTIHNYTTTDPQHTTLYSLTTSDLLELPEDGMLDCTPSTSASDAPHPLCASLTPTTLDPARLSVHCQTSMMFSPWVQHINDVARWLRAKPAGMVCCQTRRSGGRCTNLAHHSDGAASDVCGDFGLCLSCRAAGDYNAWIARDCNVNGKAQGYVRAGRVDVNVYLQR